MHDDCKTTTVMLPRYRVWHCSGQKRRYLKARFLGKGLTRERAKEVAEAKERGEVVWGDTWPDDDDAAATLHSNVPDKTDMSIEGPKLSPGKGGWPKSKRKQALRRYRLSAAAEHKRAMERRLFGTQGAASPVRRIDPATGEIIEVIKKKASPASPGKALITTSHRRRDPDESL